MQTLAREKTAWPAVASRSQCTRRGTLDECPRVSELIAEKCNSAENEHFDHARNFVSRVIA